MKVSSCLLCGRMTASDPNRRLEELFDEPYACDVGDLAAALRAGIPKVDRRWALLAIAAVFALAVVGWRGCTAVPQQVPIRQAVVSVAPGDAVAASSLAAGAQSDRSGGGRPQRQLVRRTARRASTAPGASPVDKSFSGASNNVSDGSSNGSAPQPQPRINLNSASLAQMDSLPGVGPVLAQRILSWRASHRGFGDVHELLEVKGIGPAKFKKIQALVRAG